MGISLFTEYLQVKKLLPYNPFSNPYHFNITTSMSVKKITCTIHRIIYEKQRSIEYAHFLQTHTTGCFVYIHHFPRKRWPEQLSTDCLSGTITVTGKTSPSVDFGAVWTKMLIHSLPLGATLGAVKIVVYPVTLSTKQHCTHNCFIRHYRHDEIKMRPIEPITAD